MRLFQLVILFGQLFHIHLAVWELPGQLSSGGVELFQFRFMLCLVLGSGLLKLDFLQAVIDGYVHYSLAMDRIREEEENRKALMDEFDNDEDNFDSDDLDSDDFSSDNFGSDDFGSDDF